MLPYRMLVPPPAIQVSPPCGFRKPLASERRDPCDATAVRGDLPVPRIDRHAEQLLHSTGFKDPPAALLGTQRAARGPVSSMRRIGRL
ncbi:MAG TPA: hypothetical protein VI197_04345 [Polyangiaceae bacterium]